MSLPTVPSGVPAAGDLPDWLPDETTLNRLAGEFFAALPGAPSGTGPTERAAAPGGTAPGAVAQAPRVDIPARATNVQQVPGGSGGLGDPATQPGFGQPAGNQSIGGRPLATLGPSGFDPAAADPAAASGLASRAIPDVSAAPVSGVGGPGLGGIGALNPPLPESLLSPGLAGLQVAPSGELTPPPFGLAAPLPSEGIPGIPASDQAVAGVPTPSVPDVSAAQPFSIVDGITAPGVPPVPAPPGVTGATGRPGSPVSAERAGAPAAATDQPFGSPVGEIPHPGFAVPSVPQPPLPVPVPDPPAPLPTPSTPYYFLAETSPYRGSGDGGLDSLVTDALRPVQIEPPLLDPVSGATGGRGDPGDVPAGPVSPAGTGFAPRIGDLASPAFYFVDRPAEPGRPTVRPPTGIDRQASFDISRVRRDFPILSERVNGKPLVWLDNAATTQKPQAVLDRLAHFYAHENSNIHRAAHELAARATDAYEGARKTVARFIGAQSEKNIIFVRGATEAINLVAKTWGKANIRRGDEIILSHLEHHANIVPWQMLVAETGAKLRIIPVDDTGQLIMSEYGRLLSEKTKLVAVTQVSNALGTVTPAQQVVEMGHRAGACVLIDGAQSVPHLRVNMQTLGADFFVFSGHKIFGPTGIGALYGRQEALESMPPWEGGGNMIVDVTFEQTSYQKPPGRFEAGTGNIADAVGLGAALDYVSRLGLEAIAHYEHALLEYATPRMSAVPGLRMIGTASDKASVLSFVLDGYRTEEVGSALNQEGIAVRSGHHCAQPILRRFGLETTVRPSVAFYNTFDEIDLLVTVLHRLAAARGGRSANAVNRHRSATTSL